MNFPTHLTCPYCPAQAYPKAEHDIYNTMKKVKLRLFECPARHKFFVEEDLSNATCVAE